MTQRPFTLRWKRTGYDKSYDFAVFDGETRVGGIYRLTEGPACGKWSWSMTALVDGTRVGTETGVNASRVEASRRVEQAYRVFHQRSGT